MNTYPLMIGVITVAFGLGMQVLIAEDKQCNILVIEIPEYFTQLINEYELQDTLAEEYEEIAIRKLYEEWDWDGAGRAFKRALELNPNLPAARNHYGWYLVLHGQRDEAFEEGKRSIEADPSNPLWRAWVGWMYLWAGQYEEAVNYALESLEINPDFPWGHYVMGAALSKMGKYEEAIAAHRKAAVVIPVTDLSWGLGHTYAVAGRKDDARKIADRLKEEPTPMDMWGLAEIYTALGEKDEAIRWLENAYEQRFVWTPFIIRNHNFEPLRDDPRFQELVKLMKLPEVIRD